MINARPQTASHIAKYTKQPRGGYLPLALFTKTKLTDTRVLADQENLHGSTVASAVEYLSRVLTGEDPLLVFDAAAIGAVWLEEHIRYNCFNPIRDPDGIELEKLVKKMIPIDTSDRADAIKGTDDNSIRQACHLVSYDVCYRQSPALYKPLPDADDNTVHNIRIMAERGATFLEQYGPITHRHYQFKREAYTDKVGIGEPDFLTVDTLWDFKCVRSTPTSQNTLQLLLYYLMGLHSDPDVFGNITNLGLFNPRHNTVYTLPVKLIRPELIELVNRELLGY